MSLQAKLDKMREAFEEKAPADILAIMHRATNDLREDGIMNRIAQPGEEAPEFSLPDSKGATVSLADVTANGPAVLTFFRGHW